MRSDKSGSMAAILFISASAVAQAQPSLIKEYIYADSRVIAVDSPAATIIPSPPTVSAGSGNPTNLTGQPVGNHTGTFVVRGTSVNGGTYIQLIEGIFTARPYVDARDSCLFLASGNGTIYLMKDDATGWVQPNGSPAGSSGTVSNTQCSINLASTTVVPNGNDLVVTISITFFPIFAGTQNFFLLAVDLGESSTNGWEQVAGYTLTAQNAPSTNFVKTVSASNTDGMGAAFTYTFTNPGGQFGAKYISSGLLLLNGLVDPANACYIQFFRADRSFRMVHTGNSGIAGNGGTLEGVECTLNLATSSITLSPSEDTLTVVANLNFKQPSDTSVPYRGLMGKTNNFVELRDRAALADPWSPSLLLYKIRPNTTATPVHLSTALTPPTFTGNNPAATQLQQTYSFEVQHAFSGRYIEWMQAYFVAGQCYFLYDNVNDYIYLATKTDQNVWYGGKYRSDPTPLDNGACAIGAGSIVRGSSSETLTLTNMTFYKSAFTGFGWIRMYSQDSGGNDDPQPWDPPKGWIKAWQ